MSVKVTYTCDKCGSQQETNDNFWTVGITASCARYSSSASIVSKDHKMEVCRRCLEYLGIHPSEKTKVDPAYTPPSLEELIREIVARCS